MTKQKWADKPAAIVARQTMDVTLPSGAKVTLRAVTLDELAVADAIPGDLMAAAILDSADLLLPQMLQHSRDGKEEEQRKLSRDILEVREKLVAAALVAPEPTPELLAALDGFDKLMIAELAQRKRSVDATGKVVAAQSLADFAQFREDGLGDADRKESGDRQELADPVS